MNNTVSENDEKWLKAHGFEKQNDVIWELLIYTPEISINLTLTNNTNGKWQFSIIDNFDVICYDSQEFNTPKLAVINGLKSLCTILNNVSESLDNMLKKIKE